MLKKKTNYEVEAVARCLTDRATGGAGAVAYTTFMSGGVLNSNDHYIPNHAVCEVKVTLSQEDVNINDTTCIEDKPVILGANNVRINQGIGIDLREGVTAFDGDGMPIKYTVEPSEIDKCELGIHTVIYTAKDNYGNTVTVTRLVEICPIANPTIIGATEMVVSPNEEFNPLEGVSAVDGNGNEIAVEVKE